MEKEFVHYELAVNLKELGFDEPCFAWYVSKEHGLELGSVLKSDLIKEGLLAPTYSQAFRWFREKYNAVCEIIRKEDGNHSEFIGWVFINNRKIDVVSYWDSKTYEEAELECLVKLIEIVKNSYGI